jgi:4-hydroxy-2-oxoglutarate aldolase
VGEILSKLPSGVFAPVATTFVGNDELDLDSFKSNLSFYATSPLDGVVILGSNGEFALLDRTEKLKLVEAGVEAIGGRKVVMAGTGAESTKGTIALTKEAAALGIDYALIVTPHYYKPAYDAKAVLAHYRAVADASPIPILIYIMTAYTGVDLSSAVVAELSCHPNIAGVKDSAGNAPKVGEMIAQSSPDFAVLAGSASFLYPALCLGATGGIVALGNVAPELCADIKTNFEEGNHAKARELQMRALAPNAAVTSRFGIPGLKVALDYVGLKGGQPRPPLQPLGAEDANKVRTILEGAGIGPIQ